MKLPNWFKILWWVAITGIVTTFLYHRYSDLVAARAAAADVVVFLVWMALLLMPLFTEFEFLGFKFKQEVEKLRNEVSSELREVRAEVRNAIEVNPTFNLGPVPSPEATLPDLEQRIKATVARELEEHGLRPPKPDVKVDPPPPEVMSLFSIRYRLEQELKFLVFAKIGSPSRPRMGWALARTLMDEKVIDGELYEAIKEVYAITSEAVHGDKPSETRLKFVLDVGPTLIETLRALSRGD